MDPQQRKRAPDRAAGAAERALDRARVPAIAGLLRGRLESDAIQRELAVTNSLAEQREWLEPRFGMRLDCDELEARRGRAVVELRARLVRVGRSEEELAP